MPPSSRTETAREPASCPQAPASSSPSRVTLPQAPFCQAPERATGSLRRASPRLREQARERVCSKWRNRRNAAAARHKQRASGTKPLGREERSRRTQFQRRRRPFSRGWRAMTQSPPRGHISTPARREHARPSRRRPCRRHASFSSPRQRYAEGMPVPSNARWRRRLPPPAFTFSQRFRGDRYTVASRCGGKIKRPLPRRRAAATRRASDRRSRQPRGQRCEASAAHARRRFRTRSVRSRDRARRRSAAARR